VAKKVSVRCIQILKMKKDAKNEKLRLFKEITIKYNMTMISKNNSKHRLNNKKIYYELLFIIFFLLNRRSFFASTSII
jgi:hypothetical protein